MHVIATAGHVDHGKSTLVRALTGMDPDRYAEEKRRGLTLDLGFAWTDIGGEPLAFVDVPGHERFVTTMLAGVGPVPAAMLVVAADGGWMPQSQEHLDALDALGVRHGLLVVTRCDLTEPAGADAVEADARSHLAGTTVEHIETVRVSAVTGEGLDDLRAALDRLARSLPPAQSDAPVRLWVDRVFSIRGSGTVVTGTLPAGTVAVGDHLHRPSGRDVVVRGVQSLGRPTSQVRAVARVALNLRGVAPADLTRGHALTTPGTHLETTELDVRLRRAVQRPPTESVLHIGSAHVSVRLRPLGDDVVRLRLRSPLPLRIGDVGLLRDAGRRQILSGVTVLDVDPPALRRRGAARARAAELRRMTGRPDAAEELRRRQVARRAQLVAMGVPPVEVEALAAVAASGDDEWLVDPDHAKVLVGELEDAVAQHAREHPLDAGLPVESARQRLRLPTTRVVAALVRAPLLLDGGRIVDGRLASAHQLPPALARALATLHQELTATPFAAPDAHRLRDLGLGRRELAAAVRVRALAQVDDGIYLTPEALARAAVPLRELPQPFTLSQAREAWGTTRRVAIPLLQYLDDRGVTERLPDDRRRLV